MADLNQKLKGMEEGLKRMELQRLDKLQTEHNQLTHAPPNLTLKFPEFDLENLRFWIRRCNSYFELYQIPEHLKMAYVSLNIKGKAEYWYECYRGSGVVTWDKLCVDICRRFGVEPMDLMRNFRRIEQKGDMDVEQYLERFEEAMSTVFSACPCLQERDYVSCFIAGLNPNIKIMVEIKSPTTLIDAFQTAKLQERYFTALYQQANLRKMSIMD